MINNVFFGDVFDTPLIMSLNAVDIHKAKYHKLILSTDTTESLLNSNGEIVVTPNTILSTEFNRTLDVGSFKLKGAKIDHIIVEKKINDKWVKVAKLKVNKDKTEYKIEDNNIRFGDKYEYRMYPLSKNIKGSITKLEPIEVYFGGMFLSDNDNNFGFIANSNISITHNVQSKTYDLLSSSYPIIGYNDAKYANISLKALCLSQHSILNGGFNIVDEVSFKKKLVDFLNNKQAKIYRDNRGVHKIVSVVDTITFDEVQNLNGAFDISLNLVEVADVTDDEFLLNNNLIRNDSLGVTDYE